MIFSHLLIDPFINHDFMRRALVSCLAIALSGAPLGVFLTLRRMALAGDALSHAILPGVAVAFFCCGLSTLAMALGGIIAGCIVALISAALTRYTSLKEDASFTGIFLISLALGVMIVSLHGNSDELVHMLFGDALKITEISFKLIVGISTFSLLLLAAIYRSLVMECFDAGYLHISGGRGALIHSLFLILVVLSLVSAFQALGTLMALGIILLPAIAARFWTHTIDTMIALSMLGSFAASLAGLLFSYHLGVPSAAAIVLCAGALYLISVLFGTHDSVLAHFLPRRHFAS